MAKTYLNTLRQIEALQREAEALKRREVDGVIARIKAAIEVYGLTAADLGLATNGGAANPKAKAAKSATRRKAGKAATKAVTAAAPSAPSKTKKPLRKLPVKFRDGLGHEWSGRGTRPKWFLEALAAGRTLDDLRA